MLRGGAAGGFAADTALEPLGPGRCRATVSERWLIAGGPNGGFLAALAARAAQAAAGDPDRPLRSLTLHYLAVAAPGPLEVAARVERAGRSTSAVSLRLEQDGSPVALALATLGAWREGEPEWQDARMPAAPPPEAGRVIPPGVANAATFLANFDVRWVLGDPPGTDGERARAGGWIRLADPQPLDAPALVAFSDAWAPSAFSRLAAPLAVPTLDLTVHLRAPLPPPGLAPDAHVLALFSSRWAAGGVWEEDGELWAPDGTLLAQSRQLALIRRLPA